MKSFSTISDPHDNGGGKNTTPNCCGNICEFVVYLTIWVREYALAFIAARYRLA